VRPELIRTPAFVIEEAQLRHNLEKLALLRELTGCKVLHALKAWSTWPLFYMTAEHLNGTEVSSLNEARLGYEKFGPELHIYSPAYKPEEMEEILSYCSTIIFNSFDQLRFYEKQIVDTDREVKVGLRINPEISGIDGHGEVWNPCANDSRLGIRLSEFERETKKDPDILKNVSGLHFHVFFEKNLEDLKLALEVIEGRFGKYIGKMKWVNFGGGQKITDDDYDFNGLVGVINDFKSRYNVQIHLEPGAAIVWQSGVLIASVLDIITREDLPYQIPILDISFEAHLTDFIISPELELRVRGAGKEGEYSYAYKFGGGTCLAGDKIDRIYTFPQPLKVGSRIVVEDAIQYTLVKTTMFNGVQHPDIVLWKQDNTPKLLKRFRYKDYLSRMG